MLLTDYHVHSDISRDSDASMLDMALASAKAGMKQICFTNHCDMVDWDSYAFDDSCKTVVSETLRKYEELQREENIPVDVRLGIELGEPLFAPETAMSIASAERLDMVIGSLHILQRYGDLWAMRFESEEHCREIFDTYLDELIEMSRLNFFDIMAHIGYGRRYMFQQGFETRLSTAVFGDKIELLLKLLIDNGRGIEINCSGIRDGCGSFPEEDILRLYRSLGGEIITVGSDAHRPEDAGKCIREGYDILSSCGFKYVSTFKNRKSEFIKI